MEEMELRWTAGLLELKDASQANACSAQVCHRKWWVEDGEEKQREAWMHCPDGVRMAD